MGSQLTKTNLIERDLKCIWHPFTQSKTAPPPIAISRAEGTYLFSDDGRRYIDAISSWWVNLHGHSHPYIVQKITDQLQRMEQVIFSDFTHEGAVTLAEQLLRLLKLKNGRVFYSDNGSTAVETALKMSIQYWHQSQQPRIKIICFENGYHGDTFGAMSTAGIASFNRPFRPYLFEVETIPPPYVGNEENSINKMKGLLAKNDVACFIFEPLLQGAAGMISHSLDGLNTLINLCQKHDAITIADEVMTGFGRTGSLFVWDRLNAKPDVICLSKGITGGFIPFGATVCNDRIFNQFYSDDPTHSFLHGHSYCGNPLACAAALASIELLEDPSCSRQRTMIEKSHHEFKSKLGNHPRIERCEVIGTIFVLEYRLQDNPSTYFSSFKHKLKRYFLDRNIYIRPLGNILYLLPPYCISIADLQEIYACIETSLEEVL